MQHSQLQEKSTSPNQNLKKKITKKKKKITTKLNFREVKEMKPRNFLDHQII